MEESKCLVQNVTENEEKSVLLKKKKCERLVPACYEEPFPGGMKEKRPMPTEGMYSEETHIYSPISRGF